MRVAIWPALLVLLGGVGAISAAAGASSPPSATSTPTPAPIPSPVLVPGQEVGWGDNDCDGELTPDDVLSVLGYQATSKPIGWHDPCVAVNLSVMAGGADRLWGDVNCSGIVDVADALLLLAAMAGLAGLDVEGCPGVLTLLAIDQTLESGVVAWFDVAGEDMYVWVTNPQTIQQLYDLQNGTSEANIPAGRLARGPGQARHNLPWSWHYDPNDIVMAEVTIEVCDGVPSYVEEHLEDFLGAYCPWSAELKSLTDYRP